MSQFGSFDVPVRVEMDKGKWGAYGVVRSIKFGDFVGSYWQIGRVIWPGAGEICKNHRVFSHESGTRCVGDERGTTDNHQLEHSSGMAVSIRTQFHGRLILNI